MHHGKGETASRFWRSTKATTLPVSFLLLFVSLTIIVSATYYVSVTKIQARGRILNVTAAKQNMQSFEDSVTSGVWSPGTSSVCHFQDSGGRFLTDPTAKPLLVNITDNNTFCTVVFNSNVGQTIYELAASDASVDPLYLKGDRRAIINQSISSMGQLCLSSDSSSPELTLNYRPLATLGETGFDQGKPVNTLRIYVISLNTSDDIVAHGEFNIKTTCIGVHAYSQTCNFTHAISSIFVKAQLDERTDMVIFQLSSNEQGILLKVETIVCNIKVERVQGGS